MKYIFTIFLLLALPFCYSGCSDDEDAQEPVDQLPPLTNTGENTFGCLVNGEVLIVRNTLDIGAIYQGGFLQLGGGIENDQIDQGIFFKLDNPLEESSVYSLVGNLSHYAEYTFRDKSNNSTCEYLGEDTYEGSIVFSKIDRTNFIISGTFDFSTVTQGCDTVRVTNGRFDVQYIP